MDNQIEATVLKDRVLLRTIPKRSRDILDVVEKDEKDPTVFEVVAVGPKVEDINVIIPGALIVKHTSTGVVFWENGQEFILVREDDILLVLSKPNE